MIGQVGLAVEFSERFTNDERTVTDFLSQGAPAT